MGNYSFLWNIAEFIINDLHLHNIFVFKMNVPCNL